MLMAVTLISMPINNDHYSRFIFDVIFFSRNNMTTFYVFILSDLLSLTKSEA